MTNLDRAFLSAHRLSDHIRIARPSCPHARAASDDQLADITDWAHSFFELHGAGVSWAAIYCVLGWMFEDQVWRHQILSGAEFARNWNELMELSSRPSPKWRGRRRKKR